MQCTTIDLISQEKVGDILDLFDRDSQNLLAILLEVQKIIPMNYIPVEVAEFLSEELDIPLSRIYDVITFYSALSDKPRAKNIIQLCKSTVCRVNKYQTLRDALEEELGIKVGETTDDREFSLVYSPCFGSCDISPAFRINEKVYGKLTKEKISKILNSYRSGQDGKNS